MTTQQEVRSKILFVGNERICQQIAYVLDVQDYATTEKLTAQNVEQYRDHQIYVCDFKRKSRKFVKIWGEGSKDLNLCYLDDICRKIDEEYYANRERHANDFNGKESSGSCKEQPTQQPLIRRIMRGMKHPLRAAWHVVLRTKNCLEKVNFEHKIKHSKKYKKSNQIELKTKLQKYLRHLTPSQLLLYVLRAKPNPQIQCTCLETDLLVFSKGELNGCCSVMVPFGNLLSDGELNEIYNSTYARIVKLSSLNRSYCLCNIYKRCTKYSSSDEPLPTVKWETRIFPKKVNLSFDRSCNLCCKSCRTKPYVLDDLAKQRADVIVEKILRSDYLNQVKRLKIAGMGEVFYSPYYRRLLTTDLQRQQIEIFSNGTLFNENNWQLVAEKYRTIDVLISVDAATAETYQKLRGGNFGTLIQNLTMLGDLHRRKQIHKFTLYFVVQRDNFREMPAFVKLGQSLGVDIISFQRMNYWSGSTYTPKTMLENCLIIDDKYLDYELWCVLQDPIFQDQIVDLKGLQRYIDASEKRYRKRYEREQRQKHPI